MSKDEQNQLRLQRYKDFLTPASIYKLDTVPRSMEADGKFITVALTELYGGKTDLLHQRTLYGKNDKKAMTPEKLHVLRKLVDERVSGSHDSVERSDIEYVNKLVIKKLSYMKPKKATSARQKHIRKKLSYMEPPKSNKYGQNDNQRLSVLRCSEKEPNTYSRKNNT